MYFVDRTEAGEKLAAKLFADPAIKNASKDDLLVLSIPRGGVVVGAAIAQSLGCVHDVIVAKKIGFPGHQELAIGAMAEDGTTVLDPSLTLWSHEEENNYLKKEMEQTQAKIAAYVRKFRQGRPLAVQSKTVIVVDDGIATGETMKSAVKWLTSREPEQRPKQIIVAVPVCAPRTAPELEDMVDALVYLAIPRGFLAVGQFYWDFEQVSDEDVVRVLRQQEVA
jgi:putative phosphoribosyl transferase